MLSGSSVTFWYLQASLPSGRDTHCIFGSSGVTISRRRSAIQTYVLRGLPESLHAKSGVVLRIRTQPFQLIFDLSSPISLYNLNYLEELLQAQLLVGCVLLLQPLPQSGFAHDVGFPVVLTSLWAFGRIPWTRGRPP